MSYAYLVPNMMPEKDLRLWRNVADATQFLNRAINPGYSVQVYPLPRRLLKGTAGRVFNSFPDNIRIEIGLRQSWSKAKGWGPRYPVYELLDTICHEVAHVATRKADGGDLHGPTFFRTFAAAINEMERMNLRSVLQDL